MAKGIKISRDLEDIHVNSEQLYADSDVPLFKLFKSGSGIQHMAGTSGETHDIEIVHLLNYVPYFLVYMDRNPGGNRRICTTAEATNNALPTGIYALVTRADFRSIIITVGGFGGTPPAGDYGYNYFIYYDKLSGTKNV